MSDDPIVSKVPMPKRIRFVVDCDLEKGEVQIQGPIQQKMLAIKILADAIHIVSDYKPSVIQPATGNGKPSLIN